jgi:TIR domain-containing protein
MEKENLQHVFISYSHKDIDLVISLKRHFKPFEKKILFWDDSKIKPGNLWKEEIKTAINKSTVAILMVSADFLASDFIITNELPKLLEAAKERGKSILIIFLSPCTIEYYPEITQYHFLNDIKNPVSSMNTTQKEHLWAETVRNTIALSDVKILNSVKLKIVRINASWGSAAEFTLCLSGKEYTHLKKEGTNIIEIPEGNHSICIKSYMPEYYAYEMGTKPAKTEYSNSINIDFDATNSYVFECGFLGFWNSKFLLKLVSTGDPQFL